MGAQCRTCEAPIVWALTQNGKKMPLDAEPSAEGTFVLMNGSTWRAKPEDIAVHRPLHTSHFATCPDRDQHRKPR